VIEVAALRAWSLTAGAAKLAIHRHEIEKRSTSAELHQTDGLLPPLDHATENFAVEVKHAFQVKDAQDKVIKLTYANHGGLPGQLTSALSRTVLASVTMRCYVPFTPHGHVSFPLRNQETLMAHIVHGTLYRSLSVGDNEKQKAVHRDLPPPPQVSLLQGESVNPTS
jgi:hypothetical protein